MKLDDWIRLIAGMFVLITALLGYFINPYYLFFTVFVGVNLMQSSFTGFCLLAIILKKLGVNE